MKILCICSHGNVRSVALAYLLKTLYGYDALACGLEEMGEETKNMLVNWADKVIILTSKFDTDKMKIGKKMLYVLDVGEDIWHNPFAQELQHKLLKGLKGLDL